VLPFCICFHFCGNAQDTAFVKKDSTIHSIGLRYDLSFFDNGNGNPWHLISTEYTRKSDKISLIARLNYAQRFGGSALQAEVDAYPKFGKKTYAYLNLGYAPNTNLFPVFRTGISLFRSLPAKFEVEAGARYLKFDTPIYIYTASVGKYYKKYWFNASGFLSPSNSKISTSWFLKARYYLNDEDFVMLLFGNGLSPDNGVDNTLFNTYLKSTRAEISFRRTIHKKFVLFLSSSINNQQTQNLSYIRQYNVSTGIQKSF
jgi:YaiO family outer membrane protein